MEIQDTEIRTGYQAAVTELHKFKICFSVHLPGGHY